MVFVSHYLLLCLSTLAAVFTLMERLMGHSQPPRLRMPDNHARSRALREAG